MTGLHQLVAWTAVVLTAGMLAAASWSAAIGRRTGGGRDHRFAVDRLILATTAMIAAGGLIGLLLAAGGGRPADPLHLLYGPLALTPPAIGWWLGGRRRATDTGPGPRIRRDAWLVLASVILLGLELRLAMTG